MFESFFAAAGAFLWGPPMLSVFLGTGIMFTVRSGFFQLTHIEKWFGGTIIASFRDSRLRRSRDGKSISQTGALSAALAACMGTGNIVGVATAITAGGPGALFWMCISAFFGMMTACAESILGIKYREKNDCGEWTGGAMYYIKNGLGLKKTAWIYSLLLTLSSFGIGNMTQANSVACTLEGTLNIPPFITGAMLCALTAAVVCGGIRRISAVAEKIVPLISLLFVVSSLIVIAANYKKIPQTAGLVLREAFSFKAVAGGAGYTAWKAMRVGVARGVFSNEAGLGTSAVIHASADVDKSAQQGMWGILEVFLDTIVMCSVTGFVILVSGVWNGTGTLDGAQLFSVAFSSVLGRTGEILLCVTLTLLAFASLTGWSYYGERSVEYMLSLRAVPAYRLLFIAAVFAGSMTRLETVWNMSDVFNALLAVPNLISVLLLSGEALRSIKAFAGVKSSVLNTKSIRTGKLL